MTADVAIKDGGKLNPHPLRAAVLGEAHARPFTPIETPRRILHFAFETTGDAAKRDRATLADFCTRRHLEPLKPSAISYYVVGLFGYVIRGLHDEGAPIDISLSTALFVPIAVAAIWWVVRCIRRRHIAGAD